MYLRFRAGPLPVRELDLLADVLSNKLKEQLPLLAQQMLCNVPLLVHHKSSIQKLLRQMHAWCQCWVLGAVSALFWWALGNFSFVCFSDGDTNRASCFLWTPQMINAQMCVYYAVLSSDHVVQSSFLDTCMSSYMYVCMYVHKKQCTCMYHGRLTQHTHTHTEYVHLHTY